MHPIENRSELKDEVERRNLEYTTHFEEDVLPDRTNISEEMVEKHIQNFEELISFTYKKDNYENERYNLIFDKSSNYYLLMALSFANEHINIITAFVTRKHRGKPEKLVDRWG